MARPCVCDRSRCRLCRMYRTSPEHRAFWDGLGSDPDPSAVPDRPLRVVHLGPSMLRAGVEMHLSALLKFNDPSRLIYTQCLVTSPVHFDSELAEELGVPARVAGKVEIRKAVSECDVLMAWGVELDHILEDARAPLTVFVAHGDGPWTRTVLEGSRLHTDYTVAVSKKVGMSICHGYPTATISNGVDVSRISPSRSRKSMRASLGYTDEDTVLLYVGRFSGEKRPDVILDVAERLPDNYKVLMVGRGYMESELRRRAEDNLPGRVTFAYAKKDIGDYYRAADVMVACSAEEGFGLAILEAMFSGVPVIASRVGAVPEILEVAPGAILDVDGSPESVIDRLTQIRWPDARSVTIKAALGYAEEYGHARRMAEAYTELIERLWRSKRAVEGQSMDIQARFRAVKSSANSVKGFEEEIKRLSSPSMYLTQIGDGKDEASCLLAGSPAHLHVITDKPVDWEDLTRAANDTVISYSSGSLYQSDGKYTDLLLVCADYAKKDLTNQLSYYQRLVGERIIINRVDPEVLESVKSFLSTYDEWFVWRYHPERSGLIVLSRRKEDEVNPPIVPWALNKGPGTELKSLLSSMGINATSTCDCSKKMNKMDEWGVSGCFKNRDTIIQWLREGHKRWSWVQHLRAGLRALSTGLAFSINPMDPFPSLVDEAIRRAKEKEHND